MSKSSFRKMLENQWSQGKFVCVGLDSELGKIPVKTIEDTHDNTVCVTKTISDFNFEIIKKTYDVALAYKLNVAFYEAHGVEGIEALRRSIYHLKGISPNVPVILDAKRADIGNTNKGYATFAFDYLGADAITVNPYLGGVEALEPFLSRKDKGVIVLCRTSNPGSGEFQDLTVNVPDGSINSFVGRIGAEIPETMPLWEYVAYRVSRNWNQNGNCALVVGATYPEELKSVRNIVGDMPILIPGVGFQQKDVPLETQVAQVVNAGQNSHGNGMIINSSRGIIFASSGPDFAEVARRETIKLNDLINEYRS